MQMQFEFVLEFLFSWLYEPGAANDGGTSSA